MNRILLVDDREENLYLLKVLLEGNGFVVETAHDGAEGLARAHRNPPELIISDLLMPVMDGYTFLRQCRADPRLCTIPFIVHTATYTESADEHLALELGADAFLLKGTPPEPFLRRVREVLAAPRLPGGSPHHPVQHEETELLREYSSVLIRKLEEKTLELEQTNCALREDVARRELAESEGRRHARELERSREALLGLLDERRRVEEDLRHSQQQLRALASRLEHLREEQAGHLSREMHDEFGQSLTGLKMDLAWLARRLTPLKGDGSEQELLSRIGEMSSSLDRLISQTRRFCAELRPRVLDELGLVSAIEWQAQNFQDRTEIPCRLDLPGQDIELDRECATAVFRIFQELLTNIARHARASEVMVQLSVGQGEWVLRVQDNGRGIAEEALRHASSLGLLGMRERALAVGGRIEIAGVPQRGTTVVVHVPHSTRSAARLAPPQAKDTPQVREAGRENQHEA